MYFRKSVSIVQTLRFYASGKGAKRKIGIVRERVLNGTLVISRDIELFDDGRWRPRVGL
jgi:hypothetical protein